VGAIAAAAALATVAIPRPAHAGLHIGVGADYWVEHNAAFQLTFLADTYLARSFSLGGRFGAMLVTTSGPTVGLPIDISLRIHLPRAGMYLEGLVGPWIVFTDTPVRAHVAGGFGLERGPLTFGLEVGYLQPNGIIGLRFGHRL
jgi:hypothetical protein